ncbi:insulinase family protein [Microbacterium resistens]|nr:insulinase family protein [Microbacterium resistens]
MMSDENLRSISVRGLANGARTVVVHDPRAKNCTVVLAVAAGMRHERPGQEGMMHLLEHVIYQDSERILATDRQYQLERSGAVLGGHTHMDYSEYYETAAPDDLLQMVGRLDDQVFAPAFEPGQIRTQVHGVAEERTRRLGAAPGGVLPWPHLTQRLWLDWPNRHDGTGDLDLLERATPATLQKLHQHHYRRANAVLVVFTPIASELVHEGIESIFGAVDRLGRPTDQLALRGVPAGIDQDVRIQSESPTGRRLQAVRLADSLEITDLVLGEQLAAAALRGQQSIDASAGLFGPGDLAHDDLFVIVDDSGLALDAEDRFQALPTISGEMLDQAIAGAAFRVEKLIHDDEHATRTIARDLLLRGDVAFSEKFVSKLSALIGKPEHARELLDSASCRLAAQPAVSITLDP